MIQFDQNTFEGAGISGIRLTLMGICVLFLIFGLTGAGFIAIFCGFFIIFTLIISCYITIKNKKFLSIRRVIKTNRTFERSLVDAEYILENHSTDSFIFSHIEECFPPLGGGIHQQIISLNTPILSGKKYEVHTKYLCNNRRGKYAIGPLLIRLLDNFAFVSISERNYHMDDFFVYPRPAILNNLPLLANATQFTIGALSTSRIGHGQDFFGIRNYVPGDSIRHIHWPATAKANQYMIKELEEIGATRISIFFDLSMNSLSGLGHHTTAEYAVRIVATIAKFAIDEGNQIQVIAQGEHTFYHPMGAGIWHLGPLLQQLSQAKPMGEVPLHILIKRYIELVPEGSTAIFVISKDNIDIDDYKEIFFILNSKRINLNIVFIDHKTFLPLYEMNAGNNNKQKTDKLLNEGIRVFKVKKGDDLGLVLSIPSTEGVKKW